MGKPKHKPDVTQETNEKASQWNQRKGFSVHDLINLKPMNGRQEKFFRAYNENVPLIFQDGPAGTGKTFLSVYAALGEVFANHTDRNRIVVARSAVETRKQGFLPGDQDEKNDVYEAPYKDAVNTAIHTYKENYNNLKASGKYEFMTTAYIRGITLRDTVLIVDECQNMDYDELLSVITRCGHNTRVILCGDMRQNDLSRARQQSGFHKLKEVLKMGMPYEDTCFVDYTIDDSVARSPLVRDILKADDSYGGRV